jgi:hypothetical protein
MASDVMPRTGKVPTNGVALSYRDWGGPTDGGVPTWEVMQWRQLYIDSRQPILNSQWWHHTTEISPNMVTMAQLQFSISSDHACSL